MAQRRLKTDSTDTTALFGRVPFRDLFLPQRDTKWRLQVRDGEDGEDGEDRGMERRKVNHLRRWWDLRLKTHPIGALLRGTILLPPKHLISFSCLNQHNCLSLLPQDGRIKSRVEASFSDINCSSCLFFPSTIVVFPSYFVLGRPGFTVISFKKKWSRRV